MRAVRALVRLLGGVAVGAIAAGLVAAGRARPDPAHRSGADLPPPLPPGRLVPVPGRAEMFVRELPTPSPHAPVVVLLHGFMYPGDLHWFQTFDALAARARVIAPDHRGHGHGPRPAEPFRLVDVADDVAALLRELGVDRAILVGYSMGGQVAQLLWQRHPDVVAGLVLCATSDTYNATPRYRWVWPSMGLLQVLIRLMPRHRLERLLAAQVEGRVPLRISRMIGPHTPRELTDRLPWAVGEFDRSSAEDLVEAGRELGRYDARGWVGTIDVPTAVIVTTEDWWVPVDWQRAMADRIPGSVVTELPLDHDGIVARPDVFLPALEKAVGWVHDRA